MTDGKHTPVRHKAIVPKGVRTLHEMYAIGTDAKNICFANGRESAEEIVRAVNSHETLVKALEAARKLATLVTRCFSKNGMWPELHEQGVIVREQAEAALAAAGVK